MGSQSDTSQGRRRLSLVFLNSASCSSSDTSSAESTPFGISLFQSPQKLHLELYASPPPLSRSQDHQKLSPALAALPHLFTPPVPLRGTLTPGSSPIDHSPRPPRPVHPLARTPPRRPFLEKLLHVKEDSDEAGFASATGDDETSPPPSSIHLGCTSTPPRATPRPSVSPFSSPLSASSSLDIPLSCAVTPFHHAECSPTTKRPGSGIQSLVTSRKRPTAVRAPNSRECKRLKAADSESPPSPSVPSSLRTFPPMIPIHPEFPGFYIRFPLIPPVLKAYVS
jgi:hypothetical protein